MGLGINHRPKNKEVCKEYETLVNELSANRTNVACIDSFAPDAQVITGLTNATTEAEEKKYIILALMLVLVKCLDNKMVKSPV